VEDREVAGFWRLTPVDRRGFEVSAQLGVLTGRSRRPRDPVRPDPRIPARPGIPAAVNDGTRVDEDAAALASRIVSTALDAMGTPYRWGGSDVNGFDCSGLIQFAYGEHGILLPRMSRDQARLGIGVPRDPASLRPGDILGFSESGSGVTHVGLYVGDGAFIHSSSTGVKLSYLDATDGDSRWWRERWTTVRRILT
jgi:cell wall-associated NlpC family hydrolase